MSIDQRDFQRAVERFEPPQPAYERLLRRRQRREQRKRVEVGIVVLVIIATLGALVGISFETTMPAHEDLTHTLQASKPGIWIVDPVSDTIRFVWGPSWLDQSRPARNKIGAPTMSPNGDRIAFLGKRGSSWFLWTVSLSGQVPQQVCPRDPSCLPAGIGEIGMGTWPSWSRDGRSLAFSVIPNNWTIAKPRSIYAVNADGTGLRELELMSGAEHVGGLSPDGTRIAFDVLGGGVYVAPVNGGPPVLVARGGSMPTWSPDGRWIAFTQSADTVNGQAAIRLVHPDGSGAHVVTRGLWAVGWSPDGSQLAILRSTPPTVPGPHVRRYAIVDVASGDERTIDVDALNTAQLLFQWPAQG
jgi:hypothetical protein